ncbi:right-handed parallel beta-helix repeat-containing protein [Calditrichota bacterium]
MISIRSMIILIFFATMILIGVTNANTINVPADHETIGEAMEAAENLDTVLVAPGEYVENLRYWGKEIVVGSWLLIYPDCTQYIEETIIDGNGADVVVAMYNDDEGELERTELRGFTIQNGAQGWGGGVEIRNGATPILADLIIKDNHVETGGGGIYFSGGIDNQGAHARVIRCKIFENTAGSWGAGVGVAHNYNPYFEDCEIYDNVVDADGLSWGAGVFIGHTESYGTFVRCLIRDNISDEGAGIYMENSFDTYFYNCTVVNNIARETAGALFTDYGGVKEGFVEFRNCIFWGNGDSSFYIDCRSSDTNTVVIDYSCVEDGEAAFVLTEEREYANYIWGEGNIEDDPGFLDPEEDDFTLAEDSPCIDTGDPDFDQDPDNSRNDMGYKFFDQTTILILQGYVYENNTEEPIKGARVQTSRDQYDYTDSTGYWVITELIGDSLIVTASAEFFGDASDTIVIVEEVTELDFHLKRGEFALSSESINEMTTMGGEPVEASVILSNPGEYGITWSAETRLPREGAPEPWDELFKLYTDTLFQDNGVRGVALAGDVFFLAGSDLNNTHGGNQIYIMNREGEPIGQYAQPMADTRSGVVDLTWDGEYVWGIVEDSLYSFSQDGIESATALEGERLSTIAWDSKREKFWSTDLANELFSFNQEGAITDTLNEIDLRVSALAMWQNDPDGYELYILGYDPLDSARVKVLKYNLDTNEVMLVKNFGVDGTSYGVDLVERFNNRSIALISLAEFPNDERAFYIHHIEDDMFWLELDGTSGELAVDGEHTLTISFIPPMLESLEPMYWEGRILFSHSTPELFTDLPVSIDVQHSVDQTISYLPKQFGIHTTYPNPFNSTLRIEYDLPARADVKLDLYSIDGRLVETLVDAKVSAGRHVRMFGAETLPSGVYLLQMDAAGHQSVRKIALIR